MHPFDRSRLGGLVKFDQGPGELWGVREGGRDEVHPKGGKDHIAESHNEHQGVVVLPLGNGDLQRIGRSPGTRSVPVRRHRWGCRWAQSWGHLDTGDFNVVLDGVAEPDADHDGEGGGIIEKTMAERII